MPQPTDKTTEVLRTLPNHEREALLSYISVSSRPVTAQETVFDALCVSMALKASLTKQIS